jgi:hypothetical protein
MANEKISQLPAGGSAQTTDLTIIARSGANYSLTLAEIIALFANAIPFSELTTGTNVRADMAVGSGATLVPSGSGVIEANEVSGVTVSGTPSTGQVLTATGVGAADWQTPTTGAVQAASVTLLGSPVAVSGLTTVLTKTVTMPASGGPFRAFVSYGIYIDQSNSGITAATVNDGTNNFATAQTLATGAASNDGLSGGAFSTGTYANGATVTFTLEVQTTAAGSTNVHVANAPGLGQSSWMNVVIVASV